MFIEGIRFKVKSTDAETLQHILEVEQKRPLSIDEAQDIGESLLSFFSLLSSSDPELTEE
jgi:hypothetical protein